LVEAKEVYLGLMQKMFLLMQKKLVLDDAKIFFLVFWLKEVVFRETHFVWRPKSRG
jgi:hypothetical protein